MKKTIHAFDYAKEVMEAMPGGILLTTKHEDKVNTMTIGWGTMGIEWGKPIFIAFVREGRYTKEMLEKNAEFTINVPYGEVDKKILGGCGSTSGRNIDKIKEFGLTLEDSEVVSVPGIKECPLTLECKVLYSQLQDKNGIPEAINTRYYPQDVDSSHTGGNRDYHIAYYAEIVNAYIITE